MRHPRSPRRAWVGLCLLGACLNPQPDDFPSAAERSPGAVPVVADRAEETAAGDFSDPSVDSLPVDAQSEGAPLGGADALRPDVPPADDPGDAADGDEPIDAGADAGADAG